ncbi:MAG: competence/damage-inducible protein A [Chloroflexota bacterium]
MRAEVISIGSEILLGKITDTNIPYLSGELPQLGIELQRTVQVGDSQPMIAEVLRHAWSAEGGSDLVITTGGLGPTADDLTRESIAEVLGEEMKVDPELEQRLRDMYHRLSHEMPESNLKQATLIPSATAIPNPRGTAPGWWVEREGKIILALPGPPWEMQRMWEKEIKGKLQETVGASRIISRTLKIFGLSEATVDEMIRPFSPPANLSIGVYSKTSGIEVRLTAGAPDQDSAERLIAPVEADIRSVMGDYIWGVDDELLEQTVGELLRERGLTLATMESCTGGLLANLITNVSGSSEYFAGGLVAYASEAKESFGVDHDLIAQYGVISSQVAEAMAQAARERLGADVGVGITGVAGPEKQEDKPVGTVYVGVANGSVTGSAHAVFPGPRWRIKSHAATKALVELKKLVQG